MDRWTDECGISRKMNRWIDRQICDGTNRQICDKANVANVNCRIQLLVYISVHGKILLTF